TSPSWARTSSSPISRWNGDLSTWRCALIGGARATVPVARRSPPGPVPSCSPAPDRRATDFRRAETRRAGPRGRGGGGRGGAGAARPSSLRLERRNRGGQALERRAVELPRPAEGEPVQEEHAARVGVGRAALEEEPLDLLLVRRRGRIPGDDVGDRRLALGRVRRRDDARVLEPGMAQ